MYASNSSALLWRVGSVEKSLLNAIYTNILFDGEQKVAEFITHHVFHGESFAPKGEYDGRQLEFLSTSRWTKPGKSFSVNDSRTGNVEASIIIHGGRGMINLATGFQYPFTCDVNPLNVRKSKLTILDKEGRCLCSQVSRDVAKIFGARDVLFEFLLTDIRETDPNVVFLAILSYFIARSYCCSGGGPPDF